MILIKSLKLHNFLSHKDTSIDFEPNAKVLIDGLSGAGKSSIVDAIIWCLYGESRVNPRSLIRRGAKSTKVSLELTTQEFGLVNIDRVFQGASQRLNISIHDGEKYVPSPITGIRPSQEWIEKKLIGASYTLFVNSVAYTQEGHKLFVSLPANERRDLLLEIIKAEDYDEQYEAAKVKLHSYEIDAASIQASIDSNQAALDRLSASGADKQSLLDKKKVLEKDLKDNEKDLAAAQKLEATHNELLIRKASLQAELKTEQANAENIKIKIEESSKNAPRPEAKVELEAVRTELKSVAATRSELATSVLALREAAQKELADHESFLSTKPSTLDLEALKRAEEKLKEEVSGHANRPVCPSGDKCPYMNSGKSVVSLVAEYSAASAAVYKKEREISEWILASTLKDWSLKRKELVAAEASLASLDSTLAELTQRERDLAAESLWAPSDVSPADLLVAEATVADLTRQLSEIDEEDSKYNGRLFISSIQDKIIRAHSAISECNSKIEAAERNENDIKEIKDSIKDGNKKLKELSQNAVKVQMVKDAFGPKGIKTMVIDFLIPQLEENVNDILSRLSDFTVRFDTQAEKTDGGMKEGLFITIINDMGEELPFESFSGGEKLKITVAISEALASLQKAKFRIFDEMFIGLDETSTESFAMILERLQEDFPQVLCISHLRQVKDMFTSSIMVTKHNGVSSIHV